MPFDRNNGRFGHEGRVNDSTVHYSDVIMRAMASQITSVSSVCSNVCSGADQRKHQSSASLAFVRGIHRWPVVSPHKGPITQKMFSFDDVNMQSSQGDVNRSSPKGDGALLRRRMVWCHWAPPPIHSILGYLIPLPTLHRSLRGLSNIRHCCNLLFCSLIFF